MTTRAVRIASLSVISLFSVTILVRPAHASPVTVDRARQAAAGWLQTGPAPLGAAMGRPITDVQTYADADGQPQYYVVTLQTTGFVIVAADDWIEPIIAFVEEGIYDPTPDKPLGALVTTDVPGRLAAAHQAQALEFAAPDQQAATAQRKWARLEQAAHEAADTGLATVSDVRVSPLLLSKWNQETECNNPCYNYYTPSYYPCGCVATAMAQLMRFYQHPTTGIGARSFAITVDDVVRTVKTRGGDGAGGPYNWAGMTLDPDCATSLTQRQAIGALCYDAGVSVNMDYTLYGSGANTLDAKDSFVSVFGYSNAIKGYNSGSTLGTGLLAMANPNLDAGYPVVLGIKGTIGGHAIVADGYGYNTATLYHHLNMGWSGEDNAWYNLPTINTSIGTFTSVYRCVYNVYVTGSGEIISGRVIDKTGAPLKGATVTARTSGDVTFTDTTDDRGIYALAKLPSKTTFTMTASYPGLGFAGKSIATGTSTDFGNTSGNVWQVNFGSAEAPPKAENASVDAVVGTPPVTITLQATDEGLPSPPGALTYIIKSLPTRGTLNDPGLGSITRVPYTIVNGGNPGRLLGLLLRLRLLHLHRQRRRKPPPPAATQTWRRSASPRSIAARGASVSGATTWNYPMYTYYHDCRVQSIYLASEVGQGREDHRTVAESHQYPRAGDEGLDHPHENTLP